MIRNVIILAVLLCPWSGTSQGLGDLFSGEIISSSTGEPLAFVAVKVYDSNSYVFSNLEGKFQIPKNQDLVKGLVLSKVGYHELLYSGDFSTPQIIELQPLAETTPSSEEITVDVILENYRYTVFSNYPSTPKVHRALIREYEQLEGGENLFLNQSTSNYLRDKYVDGEPDRIKIQQAHKLIYSDLITKDLAISGFDLIKTDVIKYPRDFVAEPYGYSYEHVKTIYHENRKFFIISFTPLNRRFKYSGLLYIEDETFALIKAEINYTAFGLAQVNKTAKKAGYEWSDIKETVTYRRDHDEYFLNHIRSESKGTNENIGKQVVYSTELVVSSAEDITLPHDNFEEIPESIEQGLYVSENMENSYMYLEQDFATGQPVHPNEP